MSETTTGMILLAHGARHPAWAAPFQRIREMLVARQPALLVELAFLEFMQPDLPAAVERMAQKGVDAITVVPMFFGQSGHVLRDVPPMVEQLRQAYPALSLHLVSAAGEDETVLNALAAYCMTSIMKGDTPG